MDVKVLFGPPGTGKTRALVDIASKERSPLFLAFTRSAALEVSSRTSASSSTIHSYAFRELGLNRIQVVERTKLAQFAALIGYEFSDPDDEMTQPTVGDVLLQMHQYMVATMAEPSAVYEIFNPDEASFDMFRHFTQSYNMWKKSSGLVDFNDMLLNLLALDRPFGHPIIMVDEAQDLSPLQWKLISRLSRDSETVYIAGDDDQAVHCWAGADPHGMANFSRSHSARYKVLDQSFRVPSSVHTLAQRVIDNVSTRIPKAYKPRSEEGELLTYGRLDMAIEESGPGSMVLCRDKSTKKEAEKWFIENHAPYLTNTGGGLFASRFAVSIRELTKLQKGQPSKFNEKSLRNGVTMGQAMGMNPVDAVSVPPYWYDYFAQVDLFHPNPYRLSTIHASKGMEADNVVLINGMSDRVYSKIDDNEYRVWYVGVTRARKALRIVHMDNPIGVLI